MSLARLSGIILLIVASLLIATLPGSLTGTIAGPGGCCPVTRVTSR